MLLTSLVDLGAAEVLREALFSLSRRHQPILVNLEDPEIARLARGWPASVEEAFAKVASLEIQLANRALARRLGRTGIRVVTSSAEQLAWDALEAYLSLARSARARYWSGVQDAGHSPSAAPVSSPRVV